MIVEHHHPNVHAAWQDWSNSQTLHVASVYFNPFRYRNRRELYHNFKEYIATVPNVRLHTVEVAFGERPFEVTGPGDIQLRTQDTLWVKENALNIAVSRFPDGWKYGSYLDGDVRFSRHDWALETIHALQHYAWVQPFSGYSFMSKDHRPIFIWHGFAYAYHKYFHGSREAHLERFDKTNCGYGSGEPANADETRKVKAAPPGATGLAWAFTREGFEATNGLLDTCILGSADWHMSFGLVGSASATHRETLGARKPYLESVRRWQDRAYSALHGNIGYIDNFGTHFWHGDVANRGYMDRWQILRNFNFDPATDLVRDSQGLLRWAGNKPAMRDAVNRYFLSRQEDEVTSKNPPMF